jgi:molybdopterin converting factor small subunit
MFAVLLYKQEVKKDFTINLDDEVIKIMSQLLRTGGGDIKAKIQSVIDEFNEYCESSQERKLLKGDYLYLYIRNNKKIYENTSIDELRELNQRYPQLGVAHSRFSNLINHKDKTDYTNDNTKLQDDNTKLQDDNTKLQDDNTKLQDDNTRLQDNNTKLETINESKKLYDNRQNLGLSDDFFNKETVKEDGLTTERITVKLDFLPQIIKKIKKQNLTSHFKTLCQIHKETKENAPKQPSQDTFSTHQN